MKHLIISAMLCTAFFISCDKTVINPQDYAEIEGSITNISLDEGVSIYNIDLDETFKVKNQQNRVITHSVESNSNPDLVGVEIDGNYLILKVKSGETGSSEIGLRSSTELIYKSSSFNLTINAITAEVAMTRAENYFRDADYNLALSHFVVVTQKSVTSQYSDAFMGMGYSMMRLNDEIGDYGYGAFELSLSYNADNIDARAGISLLEYAWKKNFSEAIRQGQAALTDNPDFVFKYDNSLDKNDILLNIALSQYSALLYDDCLDTIKKLDHAYDLETSDSELAVKLLQKLQELIEMYAE